MSNLHEKKYWKDKFEIIQKAGGSKLPDYKNISAGERRKISISILALILTFFYYIYLGMWKRGLFLLGIATVISMAAFVLVSIYPENTAITFIDKFIWIVTPVIFGTFVFKDYYHFKIESNSQSKNSDAFIGIGLIIGSVFLAAMVVELITGDSDKKNTEINDQTAQTFWTLDESTDPLTGVNILKAEQRVIPPDLPTILTTNQLICTTNQGKSTSVELTVATYKSSETADGSNEAISLNFEIDPEAGAILALNKQIPSDYLQQQTIGYAAVNVRVDETLHDQPVLKDGFVLIPTYMNQLVFFPFEFERINKSSFSQIRVGIPTEQGTTSVLIDYKDPSVAKVFDACSNSRFSDVATSEVVPNATATSENPSNMMNGGEGIEYNADPYAEQEEFIPEDQTEESDISNKSLVTPIVNVQENIKASFDCSKASNFTEKSICSDYRLAELDISLSELYKVKRSSSPDKEQLKQDQINWVKLSRKCTDLACIEQAYTQRIAVLSQN